MEPVQPAQLELQNRTALHDSGESLLRALTRLREEIISRCAL